MKVSGKLVTLILLTGLGSWLFAQPAGSIGRADEAENPPRTITYGDALILGLVEGITEYLPISSTGHLILTNALLGLDTQDPLLQEDGSPVWLVEPSTGSTGVPYTLKDAADAYVIVIQAGAIAAVILLYWRRLLDMAAGVFGKNPDGLRLTRNLAISFAPAVVFGLLLDDWIEARLFGIVPVLVALVAGAILMLWVERYRRMRHPVSHYDPDAGPDLHNLSLGQALMIGLLQCVAMWPGTSRSMMTLVGGFLAGLSPRRAAEYSFLLGLITLTAAAGYTALKDGERMLLVLDPGPLLAGCVVACIAAALAVKWLVHYLTRHGLALFAWYRLVLAGIMGLTLLIS